jgi:hypothetical protein
MMELLRYHDMNQDYWLCALRGLDLHFLDTLLRCYDASAAYTSTLLPALSCALDLEIAFGYKLSD